MSEIEFRRVASQLASRVRPIATPEAPAIRSKYRSKLEEDFARSGYLYVTDQKVIEVQYEPVTFRIPGGRYTPDFCLITATEMLWVECKGNRRMKNYRDSRSKLRAVAEIYRAVASYRFFQAMKVKGKWEIEEIR